MHLMDFDTTSSPPASADEEKNRRKKNVEQTPPPSTLSLHLHYSTRSSYSPNAYYDDTERQICSNTCPLLRCDRDADCLHGPRPSRRCDVSRTDDYPLDASPLDEDPETTAIAKPCKDAAEKTSNGNLAVTAQKPLHSASIGCTRISHDDDVGEKREVMNSAATAAAVLEEKLRLPGMKKPEASKEHSAAASALAEKLQFPGMKKPAVLKAHSAAASALAEKLQLPGMKKPTVSKAHSAAASALAEKLQLPGMKNPAVSKARSAAASALADKLQLPGMKKPEALRATHSAAASTLAEKLQFPTAKESAPSSKTRMAAASLAEKLQLPGMQKREATAGASSATKFPALPPGPPPRRKTAFPGQPPGPPPGSSQSAFPGKPPGRAPGWKQRAAAASSRGVANRDPLLAKYFPAAPPGHTGKRLSWCALTENRIKGSLWEKIIQTDLQLPVAGSEGSPKANGGPVRFTINYDKIVNLFFENDADRRQKAQAAKAHHMMREKKVDDAIQILDSKRRQNIEICLKGQGLLDDISGLMSTVVDVVGFDGTEPCCPLITQEALEIVLTLLPTAEEERAIHAQLQKADITQFAKPEQFLIRLLSVPKFKQRAEACLFAMTHEKDIKALEGRLRVLRHLLSRLLKSLSPGGALLSVLALVLRLGNFLNDGTRRGSARGFTLDSLAQLKTLRSFDGSTTLLRVTAETIDSQWPKCWDELRAALSFASHQQDLSLDDTAAVLVKLQQRASVTAATGAEVAALGDEKAGGAFKSLAAAVQTRLKNLDRELVECEQQLRRLAAMFGEKTKNPQEALAVAMKLGAFWKELWAARQENVEKAAREAKKAAKKKAAAAAGTHPAHQSAASYDPSAEQPITAEMLRKINQTLQAKVSRGSAAAAGKAHHHLQHNGAQQSPGRAAANAAAHAAAAAAANAAAKAAAHAHHQQPNHNSNRSPELLAPPFSPTEENLGPNSFRAQRRTFRPPSCSQPPGHHPVPPPFPGGCSSTPVSRPAARTPQPQRMAPPPDSQSAPFPLSQQQQQPPTGGSTSSRRGGTGGPRQQQHHPFTQQPQAPHSNGGHPQHRRSSAAAAVVSPLHSRPSATAVATPQQHHHHLAPFPVPAHRRGGTGGVPDLARMMPMEDNKARVPPHLWRSQPQQQQRTVWETRAANRGGRGEVWKSEGAVNQRDQQFFSTTAVQRAEIPAAAMAAASLPSSLAASNSAVVVVPHRKNGIVNKLARLLKS